LTIIFPKIFEFYFKFLEISLKSQSSAYLSDLIVLWESVVVEEVEHQSLVERLGVRQVLELERLKDQKRSKKNQKSSKRSIMSRRSKRSKRPITSTRSKRCLVFVRKAISQIKKRNLIIDQYLKSFQIESVLCIFLTLDLNKIWIN
jgi:hypothetical protein